MALTTKSIAYTLISLASKFQEFFYADAADVTFSYMDDDNVIRESTVSNIKKITEELTIVANTCEKDKISFMLIDDGEEIVKITDTVDIAALSAGYNLFCPHSREEYEKARLFLVGIGRPKSFGPLGIYKPTKKADSKYRQLNSVEMGADGWRVADGSLTWWGSDRTDIDEPKGSYTANSYLGIYYDDDGHVLSYTRANRTYKYTTYLCCKRS